TDTPTANTAVKMTALLVMPVSRVTQVVTSVHSVSMVTFWIRTMPMIAIARNDSSTLGLRRNHSSLVGCRTVKVIASLGQDLTQLPHRLQFALSSIVRGKVNSGHPSTLSVPLKQAALPVQVAQTSGLARRVSMPVRL